METHEAQHGEGMYPESPTVFLTELGLKVMSSSSTFTVEGGRKGGKEKGREGKKGGREEGKREGERKEGRGEEGRREGRRGNPCFGLLLIRPNLTALRSQSSSRVTVPVLQGQGKT